MHRRGFRPVAMPADYPISSPSPSKPTSSSSNDSATTSPPTGPTTTVVAGVADVKLEPESKILSGPKDAHTPTNCEVIVID